jgi:hypothetical protein
MPATSVAATAPNVSLRVRLLLLLRYIHRSLTIVLCPVAVPVSTGRSTVAVQ